MNKSIIRYILCRVLQFEGAFLLLPLIVALIYKETTGFAFLWVSLGCLILGSIGVHFKPKSNVFYAREGFVTVALSWTIMSLIGALPFYISREIPHYFDALFETVSGFTTTGATILLDVEVMSHSAMFWRCFTIWIGGMGVLVFIMAILPLSGSYNMHLMRAESTGADVSKLVPKVKTTALILYSIYFGLTVTLIVLYLCFGVSLYDALMLGFSTMGTGGFGNYNSSLAGFSRAVQTITTIFMLLCGINFNVYYLILKRRPKDIFKLEEVGAYLGILFIGAFGITLQIRGNYVNLSEAIHDAAFQMVSIMTTTGFTTKDFNVWPMFSKALLIFAMIIGACAGSTGGGIKVSRLMILWRNLKREIHHLIHPRSVKKLYFNQTAMTEEKVKNVTSFLSAYMLVIGISFLILCANGFDTETNLTAVLATINNIGPGLGMVGPTGNFAFFSDLSKLVLTFDMLAGRLELFPMFVLFSFGTWKRNG